MDLSATSRVQSLDSGSASASVLDESSLVEASAAEVVALPHLLPHRVRAAAADGDEASSVVDAAEGLLDARLLLPVQVAQQHLHLLHQHPQDLDRLLALPRLVRLQRVDQHRLQQHARLHALDAAEHRVVEHLGDRHLDDLDHDVVGLAVELRVHHHRHPVVRDLRDLEHRQLLALPGQRRRRVHGKRGRVLHVVVVVVILQQLASSTLLLLLRTTVCQHTFFTEHPPDKSRTADPIHYFRVIINDRHLNVRYLNVLHHILSLLVHQFPAARDDILKLVHAAPLAISVHSFAVEVVMVVVGVVAAVRVVARHFSPVDHTHDLSAVDHDLFVVAIAERNVDVDVLVCVNDFPVDLRAVIPSDLVAARPDFRVLGLQADVPAVLEHVRESVLSVVERRHRVDGGPADFSPSVVGDAPVVLAQHDLQVSGGPVAGVVRGHVDGVVLANDAGGRVRSDVEGP
mmetsp:Transcript_20099/g.30911  ORF Transcript_20099/g.30911 Transcript_20099/m.30911 type:complete len:458 (-) Transcript_20099:56-1429(-)